jgi:hypothetical protein
MGKVKEVINAVKKAMNVNTVDVFDMSTKEERESRVTRDYYYAKSKRAGQVTKWQRLDEYYNNQHYTKLQVEDLIAKNNWNFTPPVLPDPFIQVESQIDSAIPQAEFRGRDSDIDSKKAKERQAVVDFIVYNNKVKQLNTENERNLNKLGNAFWKVAFDGTIKGFGYQGDIVIGNPALGNMFNDPSAYDIDDCEYIIYSYPQHRRKAKRIYGEIIDSCGANNLLKETEIFDREDNNITVLDDMVQVVEYWYRDDEGDIACSIQVDFTEVKFIPKYWVNTRNSGNQIYPFVKYCKIPVDQSFWDKGEIETIIDLVDAADRELISALLTDMMQPADVIVYEPNALADGEIIETGANAMIKMKDNKINAIRRLGDLGTNINALNMINFLHKKIEETTGNSVSSNGIEPTKVTTASGIAQLNERADARKNIKKADRLSGFERLYELIDWTALEFYNQDRVIMIRGKEDAQDGIFNDSTTFNSENHKEIDKYKALAITEKGVEQGKTEEDIKKAVEQNAYYYPKIDVEVIAGDGVNKSKAFTLQAISDLIKTPITPVNKEIVKTMIDLLDLPQKKELKEAIDLAIQQAQPPTPGGTQQLTPEEMAMLQKANPEQRIQICKELGIDPNSLGGM